MTSHVFTVILTFAVLKKSSEPFELNEIRDVKGIKFNILFQFSLLNSSKLKSSNVCFQNHRRQWHFIQLLIEPKNCRIKSCHKKCQNEVMSLGKSDLKNAKKFFHFLVATSKQSKYKETWSNCCCTASCKLFDWSFRRDPNRSAVGWQFFAWS